MFVSKKFRISLLVVALIILVILVLINYNKDSADVDVDVIIDNIIDYSNGSIDSKFLEWIGYEYGLDTLLHLEEEVIDGYSDNVWRKVVGESFVVLNDRYRGFNDNIQFVDSGNGKISFVGDISLADDWYIMPKYDERGMGIYGILSEDVVEVMNDSSVMVANNEFTISDRGSKLVDKYYTFRGNPDRIGIYKEMGVDLVTLANNHVFNYGEDAFYDTLKFLKEYNLPYIGAGKNLVEAMKPYYFVVNGYKIGFVNATRAEKYILTPEATDSNPGVLRCYDINNFVRAIKEAKINSDYVVALVHWGKEDSTELEKVQVETARDYIDAGADLVIGSHAHNLQGIDFYKDKAIVYNLGDFIFNNETKDTAIFQFEINDDGGLEYYFIPCREQAEYTYMLYDKEKLRVLDFMRNLSPNIVLEDDGKFYGR